MKKSLLLFLLILVFCFAFSATAMAADDIMIYIDGEELVCDVPPVVIESRTLVPLRAIFEGLDMTVDYDSASKVITGTSDDKEVVLQVNSVLATVKDLDTDVVTAITLDVPAQIVDSRTMVPVRFIAESTGATVNWDSATHSVYIITPEDEDDDEEDDETNHAPAAIDDPVEFTVYEQTLLSIDVAELATDADGDDLEIVSATVTDMVNWADDLDIVSGSEELEFTSIDISSPATAHLDVVVSDGEEEITVNVEIAISIEIIILPLDFPPIAIDTDIERTVYAGGEFIIDVHALAYDVNPDDVLVIDKLSAAPEWGNVTIVEQNTDGFIRLKYTADMIPMPYTTQTEVVTFEITDGTSTTNVDVTVNVTSPLYIIGATDTVAPVSDEFVYYINEGDDLIFEVDSLAADVAGKTISLKSVSGHSYGTFAPGTYNGDSTYYSLIYHQSVDITTDTVETFTFKINNGDVLIDVPVTIHIMAADE